MFTTKQLAMQALTIDSMNLLKNERKAFIQANQLQYELAIEVWLDVLSYGGVINIINPEEGPTEVLQEDDSWPVIEPSDIRKTIGVSLAMSGLIKTINVCCDNALRLITGNGKLDTQLSLFSVLHPIDAYSRLVFLKRFTIDDYPIYEESTTEAFLETEDHLSCFQKERIGRFVAPFSVGQLSELPASVYDLFNHDHVHHGVVLPYDTIAHQIMSWFFMDDMGDNVMSHITDQNIFSGAIPSDIITGGACNNTETRNRDERSLSRTPFYRMLDVYANFGLSNMFQYQKEIAFNFKHNDFCEYHTVPKSYKTYRGICINNSLRTAKMKAYAETMYTNMFGPLPDGTCQLELQGEKIDITPIINKLRFHIGTKDQEWSRNNLKKNYDDIGTIDAHAASDCMSLLSFKQLVDKDVFDYVTTVRNRYVSIHGSKRRLVKLSTMGDGWCFLFETLMFVTLAILATYLTAIFRKWSVGRFTHALSLIEQFGDDAQVDRLVAETYIDLLELYGFIVNQEKSYYHGVYKESCGWEVFNGRVFQTIKWPRHCLAETNVNTLDQQYKGLNKRDALYIDLINLQHKLYNNRLLNSKIYFILQQRGYEVTFSLPEKGDYDFWTTDTSLLETNMTVNNNRQYYQVPKTVLQTSYKVVPKYGPRGHNALGANFGYLYTLLEEYKYTLALRGRLYSSEMLPDPWDPDEEFEFPTNRVNLNALIGEPKCHLNRNLVEFDYLGIHDIPMSEIPDHVKEDLCRS